MERRFIFKRSIFSCHSYSFLYNSPLNALSNTDCEASPKRSEGGTFACYSARMPRMGYAAAARKKNRDKQRIDLRAQQPSTNRPRIHECAALHSFIRERFYSWTVSHHNSPLNALSSTDNIPVREGSNASNSTRDSARVPERVCSRRNSLTIGIIFGRTLPVSG